MSEAGDRGESDVAPVSKGSQSEPSGIDTSRCWAEELWEMGVRRLREALNSAFGGASTEGFLEEVRLHKSQLVRRYLLRDLGRAFQAGEHHVHSHGGMRKRDSLWGFQIRN